MKLKINLVKNQVPEQVDLPRPILRKRRIALFGAIILSVALLVLPLAYIFHTMKKPNIQLPQITKKTEKPKESKKIARNLVVKRQKRVEKPKETPEEKKLEVAPSKPEKSPNKVSSKKPTKKQKIAENKEIEEIKKEVKSKPVFSIALEFESIPKRIEVQNETEVKIPPLPDVFKIKPQKKKKRVKKTPPFYLVTIKTIHAKKLESFLRRKKIKYTKKSLIVKSGFRYDVYVGGFYSYPAVVQFAKALKEKKYNIYAIKNINLLYFVCIDRNIGLKKREAYYKAWSKTRFKIIFIKKPQKVKMYVFTFTTTSRSIIYSLKRMGFYPIIKLVKHGA